MTISHRPLNSFGLIDYRQLLEEFLEREYEFVFVDKIISNKKTVFLRHDVDLCLDRAAKIAQIEASIGVKSTYYVLISTDMYNPASSGSVAAMQQILFCGHEVGLHFDAKRYEGGLPELEKAAARECAILESLTQVPIKSLSFHRPVPALVGMSGTFAGRRHTYEPEIFSNIAYVSDSSGGWYRGHPLENDALKNGTAIQLLTHPLWWANEQATESSRILEEIRDERASAIARGLEAATAKAPKIRNKVKIGNQ